jgi:hypothetical protein
MAASSFCCAFKEERINLNANQSLKLSGWPLLLLALRSRTNAQTSMPNEAKASSFCCAFKEERTN